MADISRRGFLTRTSLTVGAVGVGLAGGLGLRGQAAQPGAPVEVAPPGLPVAATGGVQAVGMALPDSIIVHVRDVPTAEISVMVGSQEVVYRDPEVVARVMRVAGPAAAMEA